jgi:hypothetical protein
MYFEFKSNYFFPSLNDSEGIHEEYNVRLKRAIHIDYDYVKNYDPEKAEKKLKEMHADEANLARKRAMYFKEKFTIFNERYDRQRKKYEEEMNTENNNIKLIEKSFDLYREYLKQWRNLRINMDYFGVKDISLE